MDPSLRDRLSPRRFRAAAVHAGEDPSTLARAHIYLFAAGATLALASLLVPHASELSEVGVGACAAGAYLVVVLTVVGFDRLAPWVYRAIQVAGTLLISLLVLASGSPSSGYALFYVWVSLYAGHLFGRAWAVGQVTLVGVAYAVVLILLGRQGAVAGWLLLMGTVAVVAVVVSALRARLEGLVHALSDAARTDSLTGLLNRRGFDEALDVEFERAGRTGAPLGLLLADLDHIKEANDRFGHAYGDGVLRRVAAVLEDSKRRIDVAARWGGDEFAVVLPGSDGAGLASLAERVRSEVAVAFAEDRVQITVSIGVASVPDQGRTRDEIMTAADHALYSAKAEGGDRAMSYEDRGPDPG